MEQKIYDNYINILKEELVPALGCTEPIAIAYAGAKAREILETFPQKVIVKCSGNIIKNVKGVTVPNSGDLKGIDTAALLGIIGGNADMQLEVLESVTDEDRVKLRQLLKAKICSCDLVENTDNLYIDITVVANEHKAQVIVSDYHTNIIRIVKDDEVLYDKVNKIDNQADKIEADRNLLNVKNIIEFADTVNLEDVQDILSRQINCNMAIAREGIKNNFGANVGLNLLAIHQKKYIGKLSAFCGAVSAGYACGAAITYMLGGNFNQIANTIINTLANTSGIICDGAKPSCAAKISSALDAALLAHTMSMHDDVFHADEGIVKDDLEKTIRAVGYIGREGMKSTDIEVLNIMIDKVCP